MKFSHTRAIAKKVFIRLRLVFSGECSLIAKLFKVIVEIEPRVVVGSESR